MQSIYEFKIKGIDGEEIDLHTYRGKKIMIVNVASECGFTPQYAQLQELFENFNDKLVIIACPCNDFGGQESGSNEEIKTFCLTKFKISFLLTSKINIIKEPHPLYEFLTQKSKNGIVDHEVTWNFHKFLINEEGLLQAAYSSSTTPLDPEILDWLTA